MAQKVILKLKTAVNFGRVKTLTASEEISRLWRENKFSLLSLYYFSWIFDIENCLYTCKSSLILKWYLDRKYKSTKCKMAVGKFNRGGPCRFQFEICHNVKIDYYCLRPDSCPWTFYYRQWTSPFGQLSSGDASASFEAGHKLLSRKNVYITFVLSFLCWRYTLLSKNVERSISTFLILSHFDKKFGHFAETVEAGMASWLVRSSPAQAVRVRTLAGDQSLSLDPTRY